LKAVSLIVILGTIIVTPNSAFGVDLINKDNGGYEVKVSLQNGSTRTFIDPLSVKRDICSGQCEIQVKGVGTINASNSDKVVIRNGNLSKE
jgi:hypothetical protein